MNYMKRVIRTWDWFGLKSERGAPLFCEPKPKGLVFGWWLLEAEVEVEPNPKGFVFCCPPPPPPPNPLLLDVLCCC